jgi:glycosyltransferase involved in cell wall biosynthesis
MVMYGMSTGGAELQFLELANYLNKLHIVKVIGLGNRGNLQTEFIGKGIDTEVIDYRSKYTAIFAIIKLYKKMKSFSPDVVISTSNFGDFSARIAGYLLRTKRKYISLQTVSKFWKHKKLNRFVLNKFDYLIAGANDIKKNLINNKIHKQNILLIHNWVDFSTKVTTLTKNETKNKFSLQNSILIGCIARLHKQKGHEYLLKSIKELGKKNIKLVLVGDGPEKTSLHKLAIELGINDQVTFLGEQRDENYNNLMNTFDIFVLPSIYEGLPRTILDAMYFGVPVIATNVNGNPEAITPNESGILVPPRDSKSLSLAINSLVNNLNLCSSLVKNAKSTVHSKFDMNTQLKKIANLL